MDKNLLKGALYNLAPGASQGISYGQGVLVGVVSTLMATGMSFSRATALVRDLLPADFRPQCIPVAWEEEFPTRTIFVNTTIGSPEALKGEVNE